MRNPALAAGGKAAEAARESGMIAACQRHDDRAGCGMRIAFPGSVRARPSRGSSAIPTRGSSPSPGGQKNGLWDLRPGAARVVRPQAPPGPRPRLRRPADLPRARGPAGGLPALWRGEAGAARLAGRQSLLHQALRLLRGPALSGRADPGRGRGAAPRLAHRQGAGEAVHARAAAAGRDARPAGDRHRRDLDREGAHLPHRRQRPGPAPADLVRRARTAPRRAWTSSSRGWAPAKTARIRLAVMDMWKPFRLVDRAPRAAGQHPVRQVPRPAPPRRGARPGAQERVRPPVGAAAPVHQGPEVHPAVPPREPDARAAAGRSRPCSPPTSG